MDRVILIANDGMVLTDGEIYGKEIYLAEGVQPSSFYEITDAEYEAISNHNKPAGTVQHLIN